MSVIYDPYDNQMVLYDIIVRIISRFRSPKDLARQRQNHYNSASLLDYIGSRYDSGRGIGQEKSHKSIHDTVHVPASPLHLPPVPCLLPRSLADAA